MKFKQLSLFLENRPAHLKLPCEVLAKAGVNLFALNLADSGKFGILRLIVDDWERAKAALEAAGCVVTVTEVLAIAVPDEPGGLAGLLAILDEGAQQIEYLYAFAFRRRDTAVLFFRFADTDAALAALQARGVPVLRPIEL